MLDAPLLLFISFGHFILLTVMTRVRAPHSSMFDCTGRYVDYGAKFEPGPAGSPKTALKKFLSVSEKALDREARSGINFVWHPAGYGSTRATTLFSAASADSSSRPEAPNCRFATIRSDPTTTKATKSLRSTLSTAVAPGVCGFDRCKIVGHRDVAGIVGVVTYGAVVGSLRQSCLAQALSEADAILGPPEGRRYPVNIAKPQRGIDLAQAGHRRPRFDHSIRKNIGNRRHPQCRGPVRLLVESLGRPGSRLVVTTGTGIRQGHTSATKVGQRIKRAQPHSTLKMFNSTGGLAKVHAHRAARSPTNCRIRVQNQRPVDVCGTSLDLMTQISQAKAA